MKKFPSAVFTYGNSRYILSVPRLLPPPISVHNTSF